MPRLAGRARRRVGRHLSADHEDTIEAVIDEYRNQIAVSNEILASIDLDARCVRADLVNETVRWVAIHMIEETARHAGHADIIRETIDGTRGR